MGARRNFRPRPVADDSAYWHLFSVMVENPSKDTPADYYGYFMTALMGLEDDATLSGYSEAGQELLREAIRIFGAEFDERHPGHRGKPGS